MVKCECGRKFKNMGKLARHLLFHLDRGTSHCPDILHESTAKELKRYLRKGR